LEPDLATAAAPQRSERRRCIRFKSRQYISGCRRITVAKTFCREELRQTMNDSRRIGWHARVLFAGIGGALAIGAIATLPSPAQARVWVSVGVPFAGFYPGPYYGYSPPPYYYAPPPATYYPPVYPADPGYAAPVQPAPSAYAPPAALTSPNPAVAITYTNKPAFTNASGQTCREYMTRNGGQAVYGTACQQADGQWRVVN
jgi:hypothetical protein